MQRRFTLGFGGMLLIIAIIEPLVFIATHVFAARIAILARLYFMFLIRNGDMLLDVGSWPHAAG